MIAPIIPFVFYIFNCKNAPRFPRFPLEALWENKYPGLQQVQIFVVE